MFNTFIQILFPSPCVICGYLGEVLCGRCFDEINFEPHLRKIHDLKICSALYYKKNSILERLIYPFKYDHQKEIYKTFVPFIIRAFKLLNLEGNIIFVPIPLHKKRELERGYNQSLIFAHFIAKRTGFDMMDALIRVKNTNSQAEIESKAERFENIKDAFKTNIELSKDGHYVLVDDIVTSGATLIAARIALMKAGATKVSALTLADRV